MSSRPLAVHVAEGLGLGEMPEAAEPARDIIIDLPPSPALSRKLRFWDRETKVHAV